MDKPLINILTRTSSRPRYFADCKRSIDAQSYDNINHLISVDNKESRIYVKDLNYIKVKEYSKDDVHYVEKANRRFAPFNLYLNTLTQTIQDGWILYLDDDNMLIDDDSIKNLVKHITSPDDLLLWKVKFSNSRLVPSEFKFGSKPEIGHFDMAGFMFHSKHKDKVNFDYYSCGDFKVIMELWEHIPNKVWVNGLFTKLQRRDAKGGSGLRDDKTW